MVLLALVDSVLPRIGFLVIHELDELVVSGREAGSHRGPEPVDPVIAGEIAVHDAGAERADGVQAAAGVVDAQELGDEQAETDADGGEEGGFGFLGREHEDRDDQEGGEEHLDEQALRGGRSGCEHRVDDHRAGQEDVDDGGSADGGQDLGG